MTAQIRSRLTYANVVATLALFLVVAGGSVALGGSESRQSAQAQLGHKLKVVKQLVKEVESQQDTSDQQTLAKLDVIDDRIIDAHIKLADRLDRAQQRIRALCLGQSFLNQNHRLHDDRTSNFFNNLFWRPCRDAVQELTP